MKTTVVFLALYFGLVVGYFGHSFTLGAVGACVAGLLALLVLVKANRAGGDVTINTIDAMDGVEFEDYVATRLRHAGWQVTFTPTVGDYGVDLIAEKDGEFLAIQCKRHGKPVGVAAVQQVVSGARHHGCSRSIVVTNQEFTLAAKQLAATHGCQLIVRRVLQSWVPPPAQRTA